MSGLTESLSRFAANPGLRDVPEQAARIVRTGFIDTVATMIAGRNEPVVRIVRQFVAARKSAAREAHIVFGAELAASADAALINATAGHALDYDDVAIGGHPSAVLVPAVLAEGEFLDASGADVLRAYLVGYEVWAELFSREPDPYHLKGWHPTAVFGTVGAAAAIAHLHRLPADDCRNALALAASMASGLVANFGSMTKPLHAGRAASCAIEAVRLAANGLTASPDAIEHHAGFLAALSPHGRADREGQASGLGRQLRILESGLSIKKYPMCYATHRVIDAVLDLVMAHDLMPEEVSEVRASIGIAQASMLRNHSPVTGLEAKFSLEFAVASALVARKVGLQQLTDGFVAQAPVREAMPKVRTASVDTHCPIEPGFALADRVVVELRDGRSLDSGDVRFARGNAKLPLEEQELKAKFIDCTSGLGEAAANDLYARLYRLGELDRVRNLATQTAAAPA
ncbi:MAG: MmgE/PrpD family protein [Betaproteobacteria bacterium]|nr:MmgE/PrpD family protein [Betaproteobacteria bacterium]